MKIFIPPGGPMDGSADLAEILHAFGLCFAKRVSLRDALKSANGHPLRTLKLAGAPTKFEKVQRCGCLVAQAPLPPESSEIEVVGDYE